MMALTLGDALTIQLISWSEYSQLYTRLEIVNSFCCFQTQETIAQFLSSFSA